MLSKIIAKNFLSWKDLEFNITKGATLVDGWNNDDQRSEGSGKSAILNAISWAIFGKLPKDANVDDVIKDGETSCSVVLEFDNGDCIVRSRKPNDLFILKSGATIKGKDVRETQSFIEEYIGCNFETFCQSVYFAQNYDKKFLSSNQSDKGKILSSIQNLQIFDKARKEAMDLLKLENDKISKLENTIQLEQNNLNGLYSQKSLVESFIKDKIEKHKQQVSLLTQQRDMMSGHVKRTISDIELVNQKLISINVQSLDADILELNSVRSQHQTQVSEITYKKNQVDSLQKSYSSKEREGKSLADRYNVLSNKLKSLNVLENQSPVINAIIANKEKVLNFEVNPTFIRLTSKESQLVEFIKNPSKNCPSCGSELKTIDTSHTENELSSVRLEIENFKEECLKQAKEYDIKMNNEIMSMADESERASKECSEILIQLQSIGEYLDQNKVPSTEELILQETEIKSIINQIDQSIKDLTQSKIEHSKLVNQHESLVNQLSNYDEQLKRSEKSLIDLGSPDITRDQEKLSTIQADISNSSVKLEEIQQLIEVSKLHASKLESLKEGFKEIKSYVFTNALNELNFRANQYLNDLFEMEASIKFTNTDQEIETKITLNGNSRSLGLLSGGQNRRFNLAVDLALADIVSYRKTSKLDLLVFDEYFKDLSEISMEKSLELLKNRKCPVILIEHNTLFKNIVDNTFFVTLENGTSHESK